VVKKKLPLEMAGYKYVSGEFLRSDHKEHLVGHAILVLSWNLISRVSNTVSIHMNHLSWHGDALVVELCQHRNGDAINKAGRPRHVYANPLQPEICPILALGV
jgi:hypothetical protein